MSKKYKITILPGDGIGQEVTECGKRVLEQRLRIATVTNSCLTTRP
jgi:isocitrate/isopropylmalate dehydrogenase